MVDIQGHIIDHWLGKMDANHPVLTIYDAEEQYHELLPHLVDRGVKVIDTTVNILLSRLEACDFWIKELPVNPDARLVIYRACHAPIDNQQKIEDPYSALAQINNKNFPQEGAKDMYINMCKSFVHGKTEAIDELFKTGIPKFNTINALLDGANYPELESLTKGKSMVEITENLLALDQVPNTTWMSEWRSFGAAHYPNLDCNGFSLREIQSKLWQYLLFSEFVLDLPGELPSELKTVSVSPAEKYDTIINVCRAIRNRSDLRNDYVEQAQTVVSNLNLDRIFADSKDLGQIVTFAFENKVEYTAYIEDLHKGDYTSATTRFNTNKCNSLWFEADLSVATFWNLAEQCETMMKCIREATEDMRSLNDIVNWYATDGYKVDAAFRHYQTLLSQSTVDIPQIDDLTQIVHSNYRTFTEHIQERYQQLLFDEGYTVLKCQYNLGAWDDHISPLLKNKKRVVFMMADAFRYEMGKEMEVSIQKQYDEVKCVASAAMVPTVTRFGMAALLPNAKEKMRLDMIDNHLQPTFDGTAIKVPEDRINYIQHNVPSHVKLQDFSNKEFAPNKVNNDTNLLIIRSVDIDGSGENLMSSGLSSMETELKSFAMRIRQCKNLGFDYFFIMADHGFMMQPSWQAGDNVDKPKGNVKFEKCRCVGGDLNSCQSSWVFTPDKLGVKSDIFQFAFAKQFGLYESGKVYFHEGLSLQENIVPILKVQLKKTQVEETYQLNLTYKNKSTGILHIYSPRIDVSVVCNNLFTPEVVFKLKITDATGNEVGYATESMYYNEMTELITVPEGTPTLRQPIRIKEGTSGDITIQALHADTNMTLATLTLQTEFND